MISIQFRVPKFILDEEKTRKAIIKALEKKTAPHLRDDFKQTVYGWKAENKPHFAKKLTTLAHEISMYVYVREDENAKVYKWVSFGTKPHRIPSKGSTYMRFKLGYRAATRPGILKSRRMYRSGRTQEFWVVNHPGIQEPRQFDKLVAEEYAPYFSGDIQEAINEAIPKITPFDIIGDIGKKSKY